MDMKIGVKTNKATTCPFVSYFGFFDKEMGKRGVAEPYRHIDGDDMEYKRTVYGYLVTVRNVYDILNGTYLTKDELAKLKLMYAEIEDDHEDDDFEIEKVWIEPNQFDESWMAVINFM